MVSTKKTGGCSLVWIYDFHWCDWICTHYRLSIDLLQYMVAIKELGYDHIDLNGPQRSGESINYCTTKQHLSHSFRFLANNLQQISIGFGPHELSQKNGRRWGTYAGFIQPILD